MAQSYLVSDMGFQWFCHRIAVSLWPGMGTGKKKKTSAALPQQDYHFYTRQLLHFSLGEHRLFSRFSFFFFLFFSFS